MILDSEECWAIHRLHQWTETTLLGESIDENLKRNRTNRMTEVEQALLNTKPVSEITCVGTGSGHTHETDRAFGLRSNVVHSRNNDFQNWTSVTTQEMNFINDDKAYLSHVISGLPATRDTVPFLRGCNDDIRIADGSGVRSVITSQLNKLQAHGTCQTLAPILHSLTNECLHRGNVDHFGARLLSESPPHGQFSRHSLATASR